MDNGSFSVRNYRQGDFEAIAAIWQKTGMGSPARGDDEATVNRTIEMGGNMLVLTEAESGKICGCSWLTFDGRRLHLHHFGIDPGYQGRGLSHLLMKATLEVVKIKGFQVKLEVHESNSTAINLYRKYRFEYLGDYRVFIIRDIRAL